MNEYRKKQIIEFISSEHAYISENGFCGKMNPFFYKRLLNVVQIKIKYSDKCSEKSKRKEPY